MRISEIDGTSDTVRIVRQARKNSRVVPVNPNTGQDLGGSFLIESQRLKDIRNFDKNQKQSQAVRLSDDMMDKIRNKAKPFETPEEVLRRLLNW